MDHGAEPRGLAPGRRDVVDLAVRVGRDARRDLGGDGDLADLRVGRAGGGLELRLRALRRGERVADDAGREVERDALRLRRRRAEQRVRRERRRDREVRVLAGGLRRGRDLEAGQERGLGSAAVASRAITSVRRTARTGMRA
jgi:hypothetical protein